MERHLQEITPTQTKNTIVFVSAVLRKTRPRVPLLHIL